MTTVSFKADNELKNKLEFLAKKKGINTSAYIKLILTKGMDDDLISMTENGLTLQEEVEILNSDKDDHVYGPFSDAKSLMKALKK
ncbi:hypothetical protein HY604_04500 [Candidatus Peregrinibacteria bacterium]|nr:hypothetical protein [Candidatus Peregrinibacteria bacterium]